VTALGEYNISVKYAPRYDSASGCDENQEPKSGQSSGNAEGVNKDGVDINQTEQKDVVSQPNEGSGCTNGTGDAKVADKETSKNELALAYANRLVFCIFIN
jgi:hypothetical protein